MGTGQTMITLGAFVLLMTMLVTFYRLLAQSGETMDSAQAGITTITLATSIEEIAQGMAFDEATIDSNLTASTINLLTAPGSLGRENPPPIDEPNEDRPQHFDDFDDFNNFSYIDSTLGGNLGKYKLEFKVYYVTPTDVGQVSSTRTFTKRMDMKISRFYPPSPDTLKVSLVTGYFHFD